MIMDSVFYLPQEMPSLYNYPELEIVKEDLLNILSYSIKTDAEIKKYENNEVEQIELGLKELTNYIELCRQVCEVLGKANNVCFDVLLEVRNIQDSLQQTRYLYNNHREKYFLSEITSEEVDI